MKFLLYGKGKTIKYIKRFLKSQNVEIISCCKKEEQKRNDLLANEKILDIKGITYALKSPGISEKDKYYCLYKEKFTFISELDLLKVFNINLKIIAITGSNGKSTCVDMISYYLNKKNIKAIAVGNSHKSLFYYYKKFKYYEYFIVELSSFMLKDHHLYPFYMASILNISKNHLDEVYSYSSYINSKKNIYRFMNHTGYYLKTNTFKDNENIENTNVISCYYFNNNLIKENLKKYKIQLNVLYTIATILNIQKEFVDIINGFKTLPYREEKHFKNNVLYINDSKSTSIESTLFSLEHVKKENCILIIGGKDKKLAYNRLKKINVNNIIVYGEIASKIETKLKTNTLKEAFIIAKNIKIPNKIVLFSPSTSSYDQFKNFIARGKYFNYLIKKYG